ncbi:MAG: D-alanine--D-alanine ligase [Treponema sp.]|nr:D-alanine--D-alanine ligase [Treponema sp.]MCL2191433.1 D-alanine--D-alanine ligase [Treponema sp.]
MLPGNKKTRVGILFGGKSAEHEVSLQSARNVYDAIDRNSFEPVLIGIEKSGEWRLAGDSISLLNSGETVALIPEKEGTLYGLPVDSVLGKQLPQQKLDVVFPILHGPFGEDGTVQGLLKLADIPFVGSGVLGSAVGMDKDVMKRLFRDAGIPIGRFLCLRSHETPPPFAEVEAALGSPVFVKPANMGSSVGISKARDAAGFSAAIKEAFQYDTKLIVEEYVRGREIECAVLGNENPSASIPGEVVPSHDFYSYDAKYLDENGAALEIPARLDDETAGRIRALSVKAFRVLGCEGLARVDFFLREDGEVLINEINTMPGFTKISMYPKLWEASGIGYTELIGRLIALAIERHEKERGLKTDRASVW